MSAGTTLSTAIENEEAASGGVCLVISAEIFVFCSSDNASARDAADCGGVCATAGEIAKCSRAVTTRNIRIEGLVGLTSLPPLQRGEIHTCSVPGGRRERGVSLSFDSNYSYLEPSCGVSPYTAI